MLACGYDHDVVLGKGSTATPQLAARLEDPGSRRVLEMSTTEPEPQAYTANVLDRSTIAKRGHVYRMSDGVALGTARDFRTRPNTPAFVFARADPGTPYAYAGRRSRAWFDSPTIQI